MQSKELTAEKDDIKSYPDGQIQKLYKISDDIKRIAAFAETRAGDRSTATDKWLKDRLVMMIDELKTTEVNLWRT